MKGVTLVMPNVDASQATLNARKYAGGATAVWEFNWSLQMARRLQAWGFNLIGDDSYVGLAPVNVDSRWGTSDGTIPLKLPFVFGTNVTRYAFQNNAGCGAASPTKDLVHGMGSAYTGYAYSYGDYFDPGFDHCVQNLVQGSGVHRKATALHNEYLLYITIDESDQTGGLISSAGQDFPSAPPGHNGSGHPGWIALATAPTQSSNSAWGATYTDPTVYTKRALATMLATKYRTMAELNQAWGSNYSNFGSAGGWGKGAGLLDEDGTCPSRVRGARCWLGDQYTLAGETAAMQTDLHNFYVIWLDQYFSIMQNHWHDPASGAPGVMLLMSLGGWASPPRHEALTEGAKYLDLPQLAQIPPPSYACPAGGCPDAQARIDFVAKYMGGRPWMNWQGIDANPDSAEAGNPSNSPYTLQGQRGAGYASMMQQQLDATDSLNHIHRIVGSYWWCAFDEHSESLNWGLITPHDNPYDGKSATIAGGGLDLWGYPTGGEGANYGDFLSAVTRANFGAITTLLNNKEGVSP